MVKYLLIVFIMLIALSLAQTGDDFVIFMDDDLTEGITMQVGWSGSVEITDEEYYSGQHCIKWTAGSGWDGPQFIFEEPLAFQTWSLDTVEFMIYVEPEFGDIGVWVLDDDMDGTEKEDYDFIAFRELYEDSTVTWEGYWQQIKIPLDSLDRFNGRWDAELGDGGEQVAGEMDTTRVQQFYLSIITQADAAGKIVYLDDIRFKSGTIATAIDVPGMPTLPENFVLEQNYPNPFNPSTTIAYSVPHTGNVRLNVYDITGKQVATLVDDNKPAGSYSVTFDAQSLPSGIYYYRLTSNNYSTTRKMVLVK